MLLAALAFTLASATFKPNAALPRSAVYDRSGCTGENRSPELHWSGAPRGTRSFALVMHDPDAPAPGGWYHWVVYNLPPSTHSLAENVKLPASESGTTSWNEAAYGGPCPPAGKPHHYVFTLYALDVPKIGGDALTGPEIEHAVSAHTLARATLTGFYGQ